MNIHIDRDTHALLQMRCIVRIPIGSHLYKIANFDSDKDLLCIYTPNRAELSSVIQTHHQLQYKDEEKKIDYIYTSLPQFLRNLINGDSTINFEALFHPKMAEGFMNKIWRHRYDFITYNLIKCYLGMAKRDLKQIRSLNTDKEKWDKLAHVVRGTEIAGLLLDTNGFSLSVFEVGHPFRENLKTLRDRADWQFHCELSQKLRTDYEAKMNDIRNELTSRFAAGDIKAIPSPSVLKDLDKIIVNAVNADWNYDPQSLEILDRKDYLDYFYDAAYNGIKY